MERIGEVEKMDKEANTNVGSASNGIDHLKRKMEKAEKTLNSETTEILNAFTTQIKHYYPKSPVFSSVSERDSLLPIN